MIFKSQVEASTYNTLLFGTLAHNYIEFVSTSDQEATQKLKTKLQATGLAIIDVKPYNPLSVMNVATKTLKVTIRSCKRNGQWNGSIPN
jgi:hypothetical protein